MKKFHMIIGILGVLILAGGIYAVNYGAFDDTVSSSIFASNDITSNIDSVDFNNKIINNREQSVNANCEQSINTKSGDENVYISSSNPNFKNIGFINSNILVLDVVQLEDGRFHVSSADPNFEDMITSNVEDIYDILIKSSDKKCYINSSATLPPSQNEEFYSIFNENRTNERITPMHESEIAWVESNNWFRQYGWMEIPGSHGKDPNIVIFDLFENTGSQGNDFDSNNHSLDVDSNKLLLDNSDNTNNETIDRVIIN